MLFFKHSTLYSLLAVLLIGGLLASCENSINPFDTTTGFYSIYGTLDLKEDDNFIRVKDLNKPLKQNSNEDLPVDVVLANLDEGVSEVLEDSVKKINGVYTHNFRTTMEIKPGDRYRVSVEDSAGNTALATATAPYFADKRSFPKVPNCSTEVELSYHNVGSPRHMSVEFGIQFREDVYWVDIPITEGDSTREAQFRFELKELIDNALYKHGYNAWCHHLSDDSLYVRYDHFGPDFYARTETDTVSLPGGTGRFGAMYHEYYRLPIDTTNVCYPYCGPFNVDPDDCPPDCGQGF